MKKLYTLGLILMGLGASSVNAQTVELRETQGGSALTPGASFTIVGSQWNDTLKYIYAVNTANQQEEVNMVRYEMGVQANTENYYCWGICPAPADAGQYPAWESPVPVFMDPGVEYNNFYGVHKPNGQAGLNSYRYVWYLENDQLDTNWVDLNFDMAVGIQEAARNLKVVAFPNPATDFLVFDFDQSSVDGNNVIITMHNMIGEEVLHERVTNSMMRLTVSECPRGMYFYTINVNGEQAVTKKIVLK